jgi:uncharacterized protein (TIGR03067 family)
MATGAFSPRAVAFTKGALQPMGWTYGKTLAGVMLTVGLFGTGAGWLAFCSTAAAPALPNDEWLGGRAEAAQPEQKTPENAKTPKEPGGARLPPPGGNATLTRARLTRAYLPGNQHAWFFKGKQFILVSDKGEIPAGLLQALLGPDGKASRIRGDWDLDLEKGQLVLTSLVADGKPGLKEVRLAISTAGLVRVNLEKAEQYNVLSFEEKLAPPSPGLTFPIYEFADRIDLEFLQGAWDLSSHEVEGKAPAASALPGSKILVKANTVTMVFQGAVSKGTFQLDAVRTPGTLDVTFTEGPEKGNTYLGIYDLQGDTLKFCRTLAGKDRPTAFTCKAVSGNTLETFRRASED